MRLAIGNLTFRKLRSTINRMVALAQFDSLTKENFKGLIYISALQGTKYADIRTRLLSKLEKQEGCTLADLVNESESIIGMKKDSDLVDDTTHHVVNVVQRGNKRKKNRQNLPSKENPRASTKGACFLCGSLLHLKKDCPQNECHNKRGPTRQPRNKKIEGDLKANRRYIYGRRFLLLTDHKPLLSFFVSKVGISAHSANRLKRWELVLLAYDFVIEYRRSTHFGHADALFRLIASKKLLEDEDIVITKIEHIQKNKEEENA